MESNEIEILLSNGFLKTDNENVFEDKENDSFMYRRLSYCDGHYILETEWRDVDDNGNYYVNSYDKCISSDNQCLEEFINN